VGQRSVLHAAVTLYPGTVIGRRVIVHAGCRIGVDGFGYTVENGAFRKVPQVGGCVVEDDVEIGANSCIDRGSIGVTRIGEGCKLDNLVHVAHNVRIDRNCGMAAQVGIAGSTHVAEGVVFGGQAGAVGHLEIGAGAQIGAQGGVTGNVEAGARITGYPARDVTAFFRGMAHVLRLPEFKKRLQQLEEQVRKLAER
jgi:UDP-3-O-[3-hydroxymyristoyl] glucosamine N-acyltransferase